MTHHDKNSAHGDAHGSEDSAADAGSESPEEGHAAMETAEDAANGDQQA